jgi:hypothetical protein
MIEHKLPNKTKSATVAEPKLFHQLNKPVICIKIDKSNTENLLAPFLRGISLLRFPFLLPTIVAQPSCAPPPVTAITAACSELLLYIEVQFVILKDMILNSL